MASTYSPALRLELMGTGDQSGTWGVTTNTNLGTLLEQAITGFLSVAQGDVANLTLTALDGASDQARNMVIELTGAMTAARNVVVPTAEKVYLIKNSTTGGFAITVKTAAGTGVAVAAGTAQWVYCDGTNVVQGLSGTLAAQPAAAVAITGGTITGITDLALADGGTGASLTDPNADRIMFWDDSAGQVTWLVPASGITISGTNVLLDSTYSPSFAAVTLTAGSSGRAVTINETDGYLQFARAGTEKWVIGNEGSLGDRLAIYDAAGAAYRVILTSGATQFLIGGTVQGYFHSNGLHIKQGSGSPAFGVDAGTQLLTDGSVFATKFNNPAIEITRGTTDGAQVQFYRGSATVVGNITTTATNTAYNTSSDERLKAHFRDFDAGAIIDQMSMYEYEWKVNGNIGYGPKAQELYAVFPLAVAPGNDKEPGEEGFEPWTWSGDPLVALLLREVQSLRKRVAAAGF